MRPRETALYGFFVILLAINWYHGFISDLLFILALSLVLLALPIGHSARNENHDHQLQEGAR